MSEAEEVIRLAAKGDGVTASGRHVPLAAPGDTVRYRIKRNVPDFDGFPRQRRANRSPGR